MVGERVTTAEAMRFSEMYNAGRTVKQISEETNRAPRTVVVHLKACGVSIRPAEESHRKHTINNHAFDEPLTPSARYWIGFLMADGCVSVRKDSGHLLLLTLASRDRKHVEMLKMFFKSSAMVVDKTHHDGSTYSNGKSYSSICICSKHIVNKLIYYGVKPRKTFTAKVHETLAFDCDFWRGVIDGDGSITTGKKGPVVSLAGSHALVSQFVTFVKSIFPLYGGSVYKHKSIFSARVSGRNRCYKFLRMLYPNRDSVCLERKREIAEKIISNGTGKLWTCHKYKNAIPADHLPLFD